MKAIFKVVIISASALALTAGAASAAVVCNEEGDCWRVEGRPNYGTELKLRIQPDDWKWDERERDRYRWRERGRGDGYWRNGAWIEIR